MDADEAAIRDRATTTLRDPDWDRVSQRLWFAEDPETNCVGVGHVKAEAIGNLVAVVVEYESDATAEHPRMKLPGKVIDRSWTGGGRSLFDRVRSVLDPTDDRETQ